MKGKFLHYFLSCGLFFSIQVDLKSQTESLEYAGEQADLLRESTLVFRLPVNGPKIRFYKNKLNETADPDKQKAIRQELESAELLNRQKFEALTSAIEKEYTFSEYLIMPDSNYLAFESGKRDIFYNRAGQIDKTVTTKDNILFLMITGDNDDQWTLVGKNLRPVGKPFPYRPTIFLSGLTRVINRQRYYEKQMRWFNQRLKAL